MSDETKAAEAAALRAEAKRRGVEIDELNPYEGQAYVWRYPSDIADDLLETLRKECNWFGIGYNPVTGSWDAWLDDFGTTPVDFSGTLIACITDLSKRLPLQTPGTVTAEPRND